MKKLLAIAFLLFALRAEAQTVVNVVLTVPVAKPCATITSETINGDPFTLSGGGYSIALSPNGTECGIVDGGIGITLPPQPFLPNYPYWFTMDPSRADVTRGPLVQALDGKGNPIPSHFTTTDKFTYSDSEIGSWAGTMVGQWTSSEVCYRGRCRTQYTANSYVVSMTGTV